MTVEPIIASVVVARDPGDAFSHFTEAIATWWPMATHSVGEEETVDVILEPGVGGRFYEVRRDGGRSEWGTVLAWDPPRALTVTWHPGRSAAEATEVDVRFEPETEGRTRVTLIHRGWDTLAEDGPERRAAYATGWPRLLAGFGDVGAKTAAP